MLRTEDADVPGGEWDDVLSNPRINRVYRAPSPRILAPLCELTCILALLPRENPRTAPGSHHRAHGRGGPGRLRPPKPDLRRSPLLAVARGVGPGPPRLGAPSPLGILCSHLPLGLTMTNAFRFQASSTGHLNTIMTFYEIVEPPVPSPLSGLPLPILRKAIAVLAKSSRAQTIAVADGEGVRFLAGPPGR